MEISIVVPCSRFEKAKTTLEALLRQDWAAEKYEVIVVVPVTAAASAVQSPRIRVVVAGQLYPPGKMRNMGASRAVGRHILFIDDDCIPPPSWLGKMVAVLEGDVTVGMVGCRVVSAANGFWSRCADYALFACYQFNERIESDLGSAAIAVRKEAFEAVGGFDESLLAAEDWDFSLKLRDKGWRCVFDPGVEVKHDHNRGGFAAIVRQGWQSGWLSSLVVPARHYARMTWLAKLSVRLGSKGLYWSLILPYASANTIRQTAPFIKQRFKVLLYAPFIFCARLAFHLGVWHRLLRTAS
jgi:cellulose synthase/poly-beta-1,6-N-acetylglucosamine synthase-like glycosyltransferase